MPVPHLVKSTLAVMSFLVWANLPNEMPHKLDTNALREVFAATGGDVPRPPVRPRRGKMPEHLKAHFIAAGKQYAIEPAMLAAVAFQESRFEPDAVSPVGAGGLMQFMPATAARFQCDRTDEVESIYCAARYLRILKDEFKDDGLMLAAYNWGEGNVRRWLKGKAKPPVETRDYVPSVKNHFSRFKPELAAL